MTPESPENSVSSAFPAENKTIAEIISEVKDVIDQIGVNVTTARGLILELARRLNETQQFELGQICRRIKWILKDKIKEGKITEKWIEECLPQEYKRKYNKSEVSSLSATGRASVQQLEYEDIDSKETKVEDEVETPVSSPIRPIKKSDMDDLTKHDPKQSTSNLLEFEFCLTFRDVRQYMASLFPKVGERGKVWFSVTIDKSTGVVTHAQPDRKENFSKIIIDEEMQEEQ
jgi:hypothetical protein